MNISHLFRKSAFTLLTVAALLMLLTTACDKQVSAEKARQDELRGEIFAYKVILKLNPNDYETHNNLGLALYKQGNKDEAIEHFKKSLRIQPENVNAYGNWGYTELDDDPDEAERLYTKVLSIDSTYTNAHLNLGYLAKERGELDKAISYTQKSIELYPEYGLAHYNLGNCYYLNNQYEEALNEFELAIKHGHRTLHSYNELGIVLADFNRYEEAIEAYSKAEKYDPDSPQLLSNWALSLYYNGDYEVGLEKIEKSISLEPDRPNSQNTYALLLEKMGQYEEAEKAYCRALALDSTQLTIRDNYAMLLYNQDRNEEAIEYSKRTLLHIDSTYLEAYYTIALAQYNRRFYDEALATYQQALKIEPENTNSLYYLAGLLEELGQLKEALEIYKHVVEIDPYYILAYQQWENVLSKIKAVDYARYQSEAPQLVDQLEKSGEDELLKENESFLSIYEKYRPTTEN